MLDHLIQNVQPCLSKRQLFSSTGKIVRKRRASSTGKIVRKRRASATEIIVKQFLIPLHNKAKRQKLFDSIIYNLREKRFKLDEGYLLSPSKTLVRANKKWKKHFKTNLLVNMISLF